MKTLSSKQQPSASTLPPRGEVEGGFASTLPLGGDGGGSFLFGKTLSELQAICLDLGLPKFTAKQICDWLYKKEISSIEEMSNLSKKARELLAEKFEFGLIPPARGYVCTDGTKKYLFRLGGEKRIETVMIPDRERKTVCVSSQAGCKMNCSFCMTGRMGFKGQLSAGEILNQIRSIEDYGEITNIVYMGMGEPFDNLDEVLKSTEILTADWGMAMSPRRITVSSIGMVDSLRRFLLESECHLAISLHNPNHEERKAIMPIEQRHRLSEVLEVIREHDFGGQRRVSFEYIVFSGLNDSPRHARELAHALEGIKCRINLIRFHDGADSTLPHTTESSIERFKEILEGRGIITTIRASRGQEISAACGMLSASEK
ncbi:MAG: 23S rRNA (adenine(2503)-C(2))-methyltransferase RlmN [Mangrovibacterium sp.]